MPFREVEVQDTFFLIVGGRTLGEKRRTTSVEREIKGVLLTRAVSSRGCDVYRRRCRYNFTLAVSGLYR